MALAGQPVPDARPRRPRSSGHRLRAEHGKRGCSTSTCPPRATVSKAPVLLQVHGGGWTIGNKDQQGIPLMQHLAAKGWVCVAINYRLAPRDPFPAQIIDVKKAIAWIREHIEEYGGDPDYIAITGGSAGGHLAPLAAADAQRPRLPARASRTSTPASRSPCPTTASTTSPASTGSAAPELMRDTFLGAAGRQATLGRGPGGRSRPARRCCGSRRTPRTSSSCTAPTTRWSPVEQARLFVARAARGRPARPSSTPSCRAPSTPSTSSRRSAAPHVVRAIDRYLHWHWNGWRRERESAQV